MTEQVYRLHGVAIRTAIALHERLSPVSNHADIVVTTAPPAAAYPLPRSQMVAEYGVRNMVLYQLFRQPSGSHLLRVPSICDFQIAPDVSRVECRLAPGADPGWLPILVRGTLIAALLDLRGRPTLHASAVETDGRVVAFAGGSGSGKTTTAAILCAAGARLVSDDVLTVDLDKAQARCRAGSTELRLRDGATELLDATDWVATQRRMTDGRLAIRPRALLKKDDTCVSAIVFPTPTRGARRPELRRVKPSEAVFRLAAVRRFNGWSCHEDIQRGFEHAVRVATEVPVFDADVPWGPPWNPTDVWPIFDALGSCV